MNFTALADRHPARRQPTAQDILAVLAKYGLADWLANVELGWLRSRLVSSDGETPAEPHDRGASAWR